MATIFTKMGEDNVVLFRSLVFNPSEVRFAPGDSVLAFSITDDHRMLIFWDRGYDRNFFQNRKSFEKIILKNVFFYYNKRTLLKGIYLFTI